MRIEFITDGASEAPLIRICGTARDPLTALHAALVSYQRANLLLTCSRPSRKLSSPMGRRWRDSAG